MAKEILTQFNAPARAFDKMKPYQGLIIPGVYRGFDEIVADGAPDTGAELIPIKLTHGATAFTKIKNDETAEALPHGLVVFPNGLMVHDSDEINGLEIDFGGGVTMFWTVVAQLDYVEVAGSSTVSYFALEGIYSGTPDNPTFTLPSPNKQVAVGIIEIAALGDSVDDLTYYRVNTPPLAGGDVLKYLGIDTLATKTEAKMKADFTHEGLASDSDYALTMTTIMIGSYRLITIRATMNSTLNEVQLSAIVPASHRPAGGKVLNYYDHTDFGGTGHSKLEVYGNGNVVFINDHSAAVEISVTYVKWG